MAGILSALMGGLAGGGAALENTTGVMIREQESLNKEMTLQKVRDEAQAARDQRMQAFQAGENRLGRELTREEGAAGRDLTRTEGAAGRAATAEQGALTRTHQTNENAANRALQVKLHEITERGANARHGASIGMQKAQLEATLNQVTLMPQADGTFQKVKKDGTVLGLAMGPDGKPLQGPKDLSASTKLLVEGNNKIIAHLEDASAKSLDPKEKADIRQRVVELTKQNQEWLGIGKPGESAQPTPGDISGLQARASNPAAVAMFESKFGAGSAARFLKADDKPAGKPASAPEKTGGMLNRAMQISSDADRRLTERPFAGKFDDSEVPKDANGNLILPPKIPRVPFVGR